MNQKALDSWEQRFISYLETHHQTDDGSHDLYHFKRVWRTAQKLLQEERVEANLLVILAAAYFHDIVSLPKNHPEASQSSRLSAEKVADIFHEHFKDFPEDKIENVQHAVLTHSFSANIPPQSIEAKILQDADRMEAIGAIGVARVFYTAGLLNKQLFHPEDPLGNNRILNDKEYALDHFQQKLLKLPAMMQTEAGRKMAEQKAGYLRDFMLQMDAEING